MNQKYFDKWIKQTNKMPIVITGHYGCGKTEHILSLTKNKYIVKFLDTKTQPTVPVESFLYKKPFIFVIDNCEEYDKESVLHEYYIRHKDTFYNFVFICETQNFSRFSFLQEFNIYTMKKLPYYKFQKLTKKPFNSKYYYDNYYTDDLRQYLLQSKLGVLFKKDDFLEKKEIVNLLVQGKKPKLSEYRYLHTILSESYNKSIYYREISDCLMDTLNVYHISELNHWINIYRPFYYLKKTNIDFQYKNILWTKLSNLKYKKKTLQNIRRVIDIKFVGYESYSKILELRLTIMKCIEKKDFENLLALLDKYSIPHIYLNYFPKLQTNDKYKDYVSRLKSFNSYVVNTKKNKC